MSEFGLMDEISLRISVLSHPDGQTTRYIQNLTKRYPQNSTHENISVISANISSFRWPILNKEVKIILVQPISQYFTDKLHNRFYKSSGAMILFSDHDSEVAAKVFYQNYRRTAGLTNPVAFVEIIDDSNRIMLNEPEMLEELPNEVFYSIKKDDVYSFSRVLEFLAFKSYKEMVRRK
ncbi:MAG: hypothetical protein JSW11_20025 [Candidatus Heimdallarchaeota archaeon]|nr:MAG: hypothetical protein JSW11_20025 [Candidatus Heimdallarchaeota archaeon]